MQLTAQLGSPHPYAHEMAQGHWDIPQEVIDGQLRIHHETNRKLFRDFPNWAIICVENPAHTYDVILPNGKRVRGEGVWWIWEAHPNMTPREWGPSFPLLFLEHDDGLMWVDRAQGEPMHPDTCYEAIVRTLRHKDIYNENVYRDLGDNIREADKLAEAKERKTEEKLAAFKHEFMKEEVNDQSTVAGGSKQFVPSNFKPSGAIKSAINSLRKRIGKS